MSIEVGNTNNKYELKERKQCNCCGKIHTHAELLPGYTEFERKLFYFDCECRSTLCAFEDQFVERII